MAQTNIHPLLQTLQIPTKVHSVYLVGSRLWGTHSAKSDVDLLIVVADPVFSTSPFQKSQHKGQYDATLLTETEFREQVSGGSLIETLCCLIPNSEESVLVNEEGHQRRELIGKSHLQSMRIWAEEREKKDWEKAMKFWAKGGEMREKGWKILQHTIAAECILQGLQSLVDENKLDLRDVLLTGEILQRFVATGRQATDRAWLGLNWEEVWEAHKRRIESIRTK
ncbi:hypothetical protein B0H19DRAFT_1273409 [Mycena capillaripes]|nr:hypothetical protein B0H19DRAFT_1273409 [Mycena capillaripes]